MIVKDNLRQLSALFQPIVFMQKIQPSKFVSLKNIKKHQEKPTSHTYFNLHIWQEWPNASDEEKAEIRSKPEDTFGYA